MCSCVYVLVCGCVVHVCIYVYASLCGVYAFVCVLCVFIVESSYLYIMLGESHFLLCVCVCFCVCIDCVCGVYVCVFVFVYEVCIRQIALPLCIILCAYHIDILFQCNAIVWIR